MWAVDPMKLLGFAPDDKSGGEEAAAPLGGTRSEAVQRLQVGLAGIGAMVLLVALANVLQNRARVTDERAVPEAAPTTEPTSAPSANDPLADAGILPDLPAKPTPTPDATQPAGQSGPQGEGGGAVEDIAPPNTP